jgi:hypothetical protein
MHQYNANSAMIQTAKNLKRELWRRREVHDEVEMLVSRLNTVEDSFGRA